VLGLSVDVQRCPPWDRNYVRSSIQTAGWGGDLARVFGAALVRRLASSSGGNRKPKREPPDLLYVPSICFKLLKPTDWSQVLRPRLGTFTVEGDVNWLPHRLCCWAGRHVGLTSCLHHHLGRAEQLAILSIEAPNEWKPQWWPGNASVSMLSRRLVPTSDGDPVQSLQVPYASAFTVWDGVKMRPVAGLNERPYLAALFASSENLWNPGAEPVRRALVSECRTAMDCIGSSRNAARRFGPLSDRPKGRGTVVDSDLQPNASFAAHNHSVFCLEPFGDTFSRKGYFEALLLGCIPVLFGSRTGWDQLVGYGDQSQLAVLVPMDKVTSAGVLEYLRAISAQERATLHANVLRARGQMQYAMHPGTPNGDALEIALRNVVDHFRAAHGTARQSLDRHLSSAAIRNTTMCSPKAKY